MHRSMQYVLGKKNILYTKIFHGWYVYAKEGFAWSFGFMFKEVFFDVCLASIQYYQLIIEENFIDEQVKGMNQVEHKNQRNRDCIQKKSNWKSNIIQLKTFVGKIGNN